jgi:hypothetical protein
MDGSPDFTLHARLPQEASSEYEDRWRRRYYKRSSNASVTVRKSVTIQLQEGGDITHSVKTHILLDVNPRS